MAGGTIWRKLRTWAGLQRRFMPKSFSPSAINKSQIGGKKVKHLKITLEKSQDFQNRSLLTDWPDRLHQAMATAGAGGGRGGAACGTAGLPLQLRRKDLSIYDTTSWSGQFKLTPPNRFAYSETYKLNIWLRLNLKWHHHPASSKRWTPSRHTGWQWTEDTDMKPRSVFSRDCNFIIKFTIHVANEKLYRKANRYKY